MGRPNSATQQEVLNGTLNFVKSGTMEILQTMISENSQVLVWVGVFYIAKLTASAVLDLWDGVQAFILPKIWKTDLRSEYGAWALVTGCTRGIGREYALGLARRGMNVMLVARDKKSLESLAVEVQALGVEAKVVVEDFTKEGAVDRVVNKVANRELGVLVNNVGVMGAHFMPYLDMQQEDVEDMIRVNTITAAELCHRLIPPMVARGQGAVVNIASIMAYQPMAYCTLYTATKYFMQGFTLSLAQELKGTGVTVQEIDPGHVVTGLTESVIPATPNPTPATFATSALDTLGHSRHTCGWWGHSVHRLACSWLLPPRLTPTLMRLMGWGQWKYALSKARSE